MKILFRIILLLFLLIFVCSFTTNSLEKKRISNHLYTFSIPSDWECGHPGKIEDCSVPIERKDSLYHIYYLQWRSPSWDAPFWINIKSYQRLDGKLIMIEEIEANIIARETLIASSNNLNNFNKVEVSNTANQKRFIIKKESIETNVKTGKKTVIISEVNLLFKSKDKVHHLSLYVLDEQYILPEIQLLINEILDSFIVNE